MLKTRRRSAGSYQQAMARFPEARALEFDYAVETAQPRPGDVMVDFPSAGGYLGRYLQARAPGAVYHALEHAPEYRAAGGRVKAGRWDRLPFTNASVDIVLTLAALHHLYPGRMPFYRESRRVLTRGGRLVIADVADGSLCGPLPVGFRASPQSRGSPGPVHARGPRGTCARGGRFRDYPVRDA